MANSKNDGGTFEATGGNELLVINMEEVTASTFTPLPAGKYNAVCSGAEFALARETNNPMWKLTFDVPVDDPEKGQVIRKLFDNLVWAQTSLGMVKQKLAIISPELAEAKQVNVETDHQQLIGAQVNLTVRVGNYNGMPNNQIGGYNPVGGDGF